jgi:hypothetical protein
MRHLEDRVFVSLQYLCPWVQCNRNAYISVLQHQLHPSRNCLIKYLVSSHAWLAGFNACDSNIAMSDETEYIIFLLSSKPSSAILHRYQSSISDIPFEILHLTSVGEISFQIRGRTGGRFPNYPLAKMNKRLMHGLITVTCN